MASATPREPDFARLRARLESSPAGIQNAFAEYRESEKKSDARLAEFEEKREKAARTGELGPDWQRVQQRIDLGQTSLSAVFGGEDDSPEARALLGRSRTSMADLSRQLDDDAESDDEETPVEEARRLREGFEARAAQLRRMNLGEEQ